MKYEICPQSTRRFSFIPEDLRYFQDHFICESMRATWEIPPAEAYGKSYKSADFVSWMLCAPIVSSRAKDALDSLCNGLVEFLRFHEIKGQPFFAINVLSRDPEAPIHKPESYAVPLVDDRFGAIVRDCRLSGVALADPMICIGRRVVRGESLHDFPGLVG